MDFILKYLTETWKMIAAMAPYLWLGFAVAALLNLWIKRSWIESKLGAPGMKSIAWASLVGVPMPLCSCGVIPVTASLREKGASKGASAAFLTATPQTGVDSILATWGILGPIFAAYRVIVAFISGTLVGLIVDKVGFERRLEPPQPDQKPSSTKPSPTFRDSLRYGFITMPGDIASSLLIGFLIAGLISAVAPENILAQLPGGILSSILLTTLIAIPFYICSTGSIPLAVALIESGLPLSAALVLLIAGPATNAATIATMRKTLGGKETTAYLATIAITSWAAALIFHYTFGNLSLNTGHSHMEMGTSWFSHLTGIALVLLLSTLYIMNKKPSTYSNDAGLEYKIGWEVATLDVNGMSCNHCKRSLENGLKDLPFAHSVKVDLNAGKAQVSGPKLNRDSIREKVDALGFTLTNYQTSHAIR